MTSLNEPFSQKEKTQTISFMFKSFFFQAFAQILGHFPTKILMQLSGKRLLVPLYHTVSDEKLLHIKHLYPARSITQFTNDIDFLLKNYQYTPISNDFLLKKEPHFLITFDDGMAELYDIVMPILQAKGIGATVFLNPDFVDNKQLFFRHKVSLLIEKWGNMHVSNALQKEIEALFLAEKLPFSTFQKILLEEIQHKHIPFLDKLADRLAVDFADYLAKKQPYLSLIQIHEMQEKGFIFGAHSLNHPEYQHISLAEQIHQTQASMEYVLQHVPNSPRIFAFPFTDFGVSKDFFSYFHTNYLLDLTFGCAGIKKEMYSNHIQRFETKYDLSMKEILNTEYMFYLLSGVVGKNKMLR